MTGARRDSASPTSGTDQTIEGTVETVTFTSEETGWSVVKLLPVDRPRTITVVGSLPGIQPGESLRLTGSWVQDRKWGEQFKVSAYLSVQPSTLAGIEKYLGSGLIQGLGPVMASRLVERFGFETLEVIERQPQRLTEVEGIGPKRKELIVAAWIEQQAIKQVMLFLQTHGVSTAHGVKIFKQYGDRAIPLLQANPYRLAMDITGVGFKTADRIAASLGIPPTSPRRAEAGLLHTLSQMADEGHMFCPAEELLTRAEGMLQLEPALLHEALAQLATQDQVMVEGEGADAAIYLRPLYLAETGAARRLAELAGAATAPPDAEELQAALSWLEAELALTLAPEQREAIGRAVNERVLVITGGPGTGKTTIVRGVVRLLKARARRVLLCAPTGRAAKRLAEATGENARTIHRLLELNPRGRRFERDQHHPLEADTLIVDEASMVDASLLSHLVKALPDGCQLIAVGDVDQLPSVGPGQVLGDLIRSGAAGVVTLTEIFRQARQSLIVVNAHRVNQGLLPLGEEDAPARSGGGLADFFFIARESPEAVLATVEELVLRRIPSRFGLHPVDQIQVLTPMHRGTLGSVNLNARLQAALNPTGEGLSRGGRLFRPGDKVMQVRNNYDLDLYNGDIGRVQAIDAEQQQVTLRFDERTLAIDLGDLDDLVHAYACTIHKAQGSEYPAVVIPLHTQHYPMLQRNLLYTGITRGRRLVVLVGSAKALALAVKNVRVGGRYTRMAARLARRPPGD